MVVTRSNDMMILRSAIRAPARFGGNRLLTKARNAHLSAGARYAAICRSGLGGGPAAGSSKLRRSTATPAEQLVRANELLTRVTEKDHARAKVSAAPVDVLVDEEPVPETAAAAAIEEEMDVPIVVEDEESEEEMDAPVVVEGDEEQEPEPRDQATTMWRSSMQTRMGGSVVDVGGNALAGRLKHKETKMFPMVSSSNRYAGESPPIKFRITPDRIREAFQRQGPFRVVMPDSVWVETESSRDLSTYVVTGFSGETFATMQAHLDCLTGSGAGQSFTLPAILLVINDEVVMELNETQIPEPPVDRASDVRAIEYAREITPGPRDIAVFLDLNLRNHMACLQAGWLKGNLLGMEMCWQNCLYMRLHGAKVIYTPEGFERFLLSDMPDRLGIRDRIRYVYADYCGALPHELLARALGSLPNLGVYAYTLDPRTGTDKPLALPGFHPSMLNTSRMVSALWSHSRETVRAADGCVRSGACHRAARRASPPKA